MSELAIALIGRYSTPLFLYGAAVCDTIRGDVQFVGLSNGRIPWPTGKRDQSKRLVIYAGLEQAIRTESNLAVCYWWGITTQTVSKWRKSLGVGITTPGTSRVFRKMCSGAWS